MNYGTGGVRRSEIATGSTPDGYFRTPGTSHPEGGNYGTPVKIQIKGLLDKKRSAAFNARRLRGIAPTLKKPENVTPEQNLGPRR